MALTEEDIQRIIEKVHEENVHFFLAPISGIDIVLPELWRNALSQNDPINITIQTIWNPMVEDLPKTLEVLKTSLQGIGLLSTRENPLSLVYFFKMNNKAYAFRGYDPSYKSKSGVVSLPTDFLKFYEVHNGWIDVSSNSSGPMPNNSWFFLSEILDEPEIRETQPYFDPYQFLVVFNNGGGDYLGFDISQPQPLCYIWWKDDSPEIVPDVWKELDEWISSDLGHFEPRNS